jgi:integral membrane sensor domain MASE1
MSERANNGGWPSTRTARHRGLAANRAEITKAGQAALQFAVVALAYFIVAKLGLYLAVVHPSASPILPATGIAIAAVLVWGYRVAPAVFIAAFFVNQLTAGSAFTSLGIAAGNTLEAVIASYLVRRWDGGQHVFDTAAGVAKFAIIAVVSTAVSASIGPTSLALGGYLETNILSHVALTWWLGDLAGALIVTPVVLLWARNPTWRLFWENSTSIALSYVGAVGVGLIAFSPLIPQVPIRDLQSYRYFGRGCASIHAIRRT